MNQFAVRLTSCPFLEGTIILSKSEMSTDTNRTMNESKSSNIHDIIQLLIRILYTNIDDRGMEDISRWVTPPFRILCNK